MKWQVPVQWLSNGMLEVNAESMSNALMVAASKCSHATTPGMSATLVPGTMNICGTPNLVTTISQMHETICVTTDTLALIEGALKWELNDDPEDTVPNGERYAFSTVYGDGYSLDICCTGTDAKPVITTVLYDDTGREIVEITEKHFLGKHSISYNNTEYICSIQQSFN